MALKLPIYLDHHATTPVDPRVVDAMAPYWSEDFGNASSAGHVFMARRGGRGDRPRAPGVGDRGVGSEIVFTSGTTESDNLALIGLARGHRGRRDHLITSAIEHPAVLDTCRFLVGEGFSDDPARRRRGPSAIPRRSRRRSDGSEIVFTSGTTRQSRLIGLARGHRGPII